ncbi:helix-turn-helix domain-containing protein [Microbacterium sp. No. 7]|uniref:helix-turn-helix domain-containing protein n=1 Tax=Microbacterium sp. No. 7 TaxID=1714373 RepID=UPI003008EC14
MSTVNEQPTALSEFETLLRSMTLDQLPDLLTIRELSIWARIPVNTLYEWRAKGVGPTPMKMGKHLRYSKERVRAWQRDLESRVA